MTRRALARLAVGIGVLMLFPAVALAQTPELTSVSVNPSTPPPSFSGTGLVQILPGAPAGGVTISLSSSNPSALQVPSSVSIPEGAESAEFSYTTGAVPGGTTATLTATLGSSSVSTEVTITASKLESLLTFPNAVEGGKGETVLPDLSGPAPSEGAVIELKSSSPLVPLPASVTIPAGEFLTSVSVTTGAVTEVTDVELSASYNGVTVSHVLALTPPETPTSLSLNPTTTEGTNGSLGTVHVSYQALNNNPAIALSSSDPSVASVPSEVTIGQEQTSANFQITTADVSSPTNVTITASGNGTSVSAVLTVDPPPPTPPELQSITVSPGTVAGGSSATGTATLNQPAPAGGTVRQLVTSDTRRGRSTVSVTVSTGATAPVPR